MTVLSSRLMRAIRPDKPAAGVSRDLVVWAYRRLLGREPESEAVIIGATRYPSPLALIDAILSSEEFRARGMRRMEHFAPPLEVDWRLEPAAMPALLARIAKTWSRLGEERPFWSVLAGPEYLPENVTGQEERFYASGGDDLSILLATLARVGRDPADFSRVLEFGCGVGRVTHHLAQRFAQIVACDISPSHLALAGAALRDRGICNVELRHATTADFGMSEPFDLWFNRLVLQHNPPPLIAAILKRALALLRPRGLAVFQVPVYLAGYRFKTAEYLAAPPSSGPFEMHALPQPAVLAIAHEAGCRLLEIREEDSAGDLWISQFFTFEKSSRDWGSLTYCPRGA